MYEISSRPEGEVNIVSRLISGERKLMTKYDHDEIDE